MIGLFLITHGSLGESLIQCACHVLNRRPVQLGQLGVSAQDDPLDVQYGPAHDIALVPGGVLAGLAGDTRATVNSLHGQGVRRLGEGLVVEAQAPDGLVEAFRHDGPAFMLAVQWHPEWKVRENAFYLATFRAFGDACRARAARRPA